MHTTRGQGSLRDIAKLVHIRREDLVPVQGQEGLWRLPITEKPGVFPKAGKALIDIYMKTLHSEIVERARSRGEIITYDDAISFLLVKGVLSARKGEMAVGITINDENEELWSQDNSTGTDTPLTLSKPPRPPATADAESSTRPTIPRELRKPEAGKKISTMMMIDGLPSLGSDILAVGDTLEIHQTEAVRRKDEHEIPLMVMRYRVRKLDMAEDRSMEKEKENEMEKKQGTSLSG